MCKHESVLKILKEGGGHTRCLALHYKPDGSFAPACIICPDCRKHVDWKAQEAMLGGLVKKARLWLWLTALRFASRVEERRNRN